MTLFILNMLSAYYCDLPRLGTMAPKDDLIRKYVSRWCTSEDDILIEADSPYMAASIVLAHLYTDDPEWGGKRDTFKKITITTSTVTFGDPILYTYDEARVSFIHDDGFEGALFTVETYPQEVQ